MKLRVQQQQLFQRIILEERPLWLHMPLTCSLKGRSALKASQRWPGSRLAELSAEAIPHSLFAMKFINRRHARAQTLAFHLWKAKSKCFLRTRRPECELFKSDDHRVVKAVWDSDEARPALVFAVWSARRLSPTLTFIQVSVISRVKRGRRQLIHHLNPTKLQSNSEKVKMCHCGCDKGVV